MASVDTWTDLQVVLRYNDIGSWQLTTPATTSARYAASAGNGLVIRRDGRTLIAGPTTSYTETWDDSNQGPGTFTITGRDDLVDLARQLAEPDPLVAGTPTQAYDRITGPAETVMRSYVDRNIGASSLTGRVRHRMGQTADQGLGDSVTGNARYDVLLDLITSLATVAGLGFRAVQGTDGTALFDVYEPTDRSDTAVFSRGGGNLIGYSYTLSAPTATHVTVAGQGEGVDRSVVDVANLTAEDDWDAVVRVFNDRRDTADNDDYLQQAAETLADGAATAGLSITPVDLPTLTYGQHYDLGDRVAVDIDDTTRITDILTQVSFTVNSSDGETLTPTVGQGDAGQTPGLFTALRALGTRVGLLERRV